MRATFGVLIGAAALPAFGPAHSVTVDGNAGDWVGTPPAQVHDTAISAGEWIYRGEAGDVRGDPSGTIETNADITEVRFTADASNLYVLVRLDDVTVTDEVHVAVGIEFTNNPSDTASNFLGDESGVVYPNPQAYVEYNIAVHNATPGSTVVELFHDNGSGFWYAPPSGWDAHINPSAGFNLVEARIPLADINLLANSNFRVTLATFDNDSNGGGGVGFNNDVDTTQDYPVCDALDCMAGTPGVSQGAFLRELNDGTLNQSHAISLGTIPVELSAFSAD